MYQPPIITHGFNRQSFHRQPVSNLRQINDIVWNQNNDIQQTGGIIPQSFSSISNQQLISEYANLEKQLYSSLSNSNGVKLHSQKPLIHNYENSLATALLQMTRTDDPSKRRMHFAFYYFIFTIFFFRI